ncbi:MAG: hypothetical protein ISR78_04480 [Spirochaetia bacterium]|nr:hypothetical protein [Spirochaetia bacterium]
MDLGKLIFLSIIGYVILFIHDLSQLKRNTHVTLITYVSYPIIITPYILMFTLYSPNNTTPYWLTVFLLLIALSLFLLLVYSVLLEIPIKIRQGKIAVDGKKRVVYKQGTYSFSRHPGFIWMTLLNASIYCLFLQREILLLTLVLTLCNLALIIIEDLYIFPAVFSDYNQYKKEVPFLFKFPFTKKL